MPEWVKFLSKIFKERPYVITLGLLGLFLVAVGVFSVVVVGNRNKDEGVVIKKAFDSAQDSGEAEIFVDVAGAVEKPGVYQLSSNSRVNDVLVVAGGLGAKADREWVSQNLNLAQKLTDGQKIYIPSQEEVVKDGPSSEIYKGPSFVNINMATGAELDTLYGVGPATAQKIIDNRPYASTEELLTKKVVKSNVYESIKNQITVF
ncbi:MAG: helix-hairpin-helix domain-containing protein [Candidatus Beckwithbacteria bacterium]|nr:helix-hairpin-helix domain-containing protein [Candidatus Beckwithbacteria bacterium]